MIDMSRQTATRTSRIGLSDGAVATTRCGRHGEVLELRSRSGELVFEYDAATGRSRIVVPSGDLELCAEQGNIDLVAGKSIRLIGKDSVEIESDRSVRFRIFDGIRRVTSSLSMRAGKMTVKGEQMACVAARAHVDIEHARFASKRLEVCAETVRTVASRVETLAGTLMENVGEAYRKVRRLSQLRAGRVRTLVDSTCHLKARKVYLRSEEDFRIDGKRIDLG